MGLLSSGERPPCGISTKMGELTVQPIAFGQPNDEFPPISEVARGCSCRMVEAGLPAVDY